MILNKIKKKGTKNLAREVQIKSIPEKLISELNNFIKRNAIIQLPVSHSIVGTCKQCLKAHTMKKAKEMNLHEGIINALMSEIDGETGHLGFYMDNNQLIKL